MATNKIKKILFFFDSRATFSYSNNIIKVFKKNKKSYEILVSGNYLENISKIDNKIFKKNKLRINYKVKFGSPDQGPVLSDATLTVLSSKNNPQVEVRFRDLFPVSLTGLQYDQQATDVEYLTSTVTFRYTIYDFANVGSSSTQVTTS